MPYATSGNNDKGLNRNGLGHRKPRPHHKEPAPPPSPVTITRADGTVEVRPAYTPKELAKINQKKRKQRRS